MRIRDLDIEELHRRAARVFRHRDTRIVQREADEIISLALRYHRELENREFRAMFNPALDRIFQTRATIRRYK